MKWEYLLDVKGRTEHADGWSGHEHSKFQDYLTSKGSDGWELVDVGREINRDGWISRTHFIFKRPL
jgi:hypothetical protein